jgi:hypothetical protein
VGVIACRNAPTPTASLSTLPTRGRVRKKSKTPGSSPGVFVCGILSIVMAGVVPAIHVFILNKKDVNARPKAGMTKMRSVRPVESAC